MAAPLNPSDLAFMGGAYGIRKRLPVVPGFEGSGEVVAAGAGLRARMLLGRRVACAAPSDGDGTWAEYMLAEASQCIPLRRDTNLEQASMMIVNPFTAWALLGLARESGAKAVVQTAAASALGRMIQRLATARGLQVVNVVRRPEQVALLESEGARHVLDSSAEDFDARLKELCVRLRASVAFDAVAGELTGRILSAMPKGGAAIVYGALSMQPCTLDPRSLIFERKGVRGFWLVDWMRDAGIVKKYLAARGVQRLLKGELRTEIRARLPLERAAEGVRLYAREMTSGKVIFVPRPSGQGPRVRGTISEINF